MSSHDSISMVLKCMLKGAADFLIKPVRRNELRNLWQHVWRRHSVCINISASCNPFFSFFFFLVLIHIQLSETCFLSLSSLFLFISCSADMFLKIYTTCIIKVEQFLKTILLAAIPVIMQLHHRKIREVRK